LLRLPPGLEWWAHAPEGREWLARLPRIVARCADRWALELEQPFETRISLVVPVTICDSQRRAVLKVNFPEAESEHEADALALWAGRGAVELLAHDPGQRALLVERCDPGTMLWARAEDDESMGIAASVLGRIWRPPPARHGYRLLADEGARWAEELPAEWAALGRPYECSLLDEALEHLDHLSASGVDSVVCHQDFHGGNALLSRRGWLAIDPKPLVGEKAFDVASLLRDRRADLAVDPRPVSRMRRRLDLLSSELGLERERARGWGVVHALAWAVDESGCDELMVACARWLSEVR
jgi:streptomycin 6-kinase